MASLDYISQFSQGIPATQPDRSPSRTPRRDLPPSQDICGVPSFHGPLHHALHVPRTQQRPWPTYLSQSRGWSHPNAPATASMPQSWSWTPTPPTLLPTRPPFPPLPPTCPPPPPPQGPSTPQRFSATSPKSSTYGTPPSISKFNQGYRVTPCDELETGHRLPRHPEGEWPRLPVHYSLQQIKPVYKDIEGMDPLQVPLWKFLYQGLNNTGFVAKPMAAMSSPALRQHRYDCLCG